MNDVILESTKAHTPKKEKIMYIPMGITIKLLVDISPYPPARPYISAISKNILKSLSKNMLIKEIIKVYGVKSERKMKRVLNKEFEIINKEIFPGIFEGV